MPPIFIVKLPTMPTVRTQGGGGGGPQQQASSSGATTPAARTTFRPPWIKDGPEPLPMPAAPWTLARARDRRTSRDEPAAEPPAPAPAAPAPGRKQSKITIVPSQPSGQENGVDPKGLKKDVVNAATAKKQQQAAPEPAPPAVKAKEPPPERKINIQVESKQRSAAKEPPRPEPKAQPKAQPKAEPKETKAAMPPKATPPKDATQKPPAPREVRRPPEPQPQPTPLARSRSNRSASNLAPVPPPQPPPAPPPPPPDFKHTPLTKTQEQKLDTLRTGRTRKRPDWSAMMKEVEQGLRLRHVQCNDRSEPLLPGAKVKGQFMYESEKPNVHNQLLKEIQGGVKLKRVQTNDRSRPVLQGLRKFRRQLTVEEQQQQQQDEPDAVVEVDELDDIDTLRDDLQSTKQMLALELRNKEAVEKENKRLQSRILNLELECEEERKRKAAAPAATAGDKKSLQAEKEAQQLRGQLSEAQKQTHELEQRVHEADLQADLLRAELDELRRRNTMLERRVSTTSKDQPLAKQPSAKKLAQSASALNAGPRPDANANANAAPAEDSEEEEEEVTETESESEEDSSEDEEKMAALREKRQAREIKLLSTKVRSLKEKQDITRKERRALRLTLRNQNKALVEERKKYKKLQKEVDKMAKLMKEDDDEEEEEEEEEEEMEEEEESEEESTTEESEEDESEGELPAEAPFDDRKKNFTERAKRHENILAAIKKGNYLLKANVEKVKDDLFKQKELSIAMQEDLNSVLAELG